MVAISILFPLSPDGPLLSCDIFEQGASKWEPKGSFCVSAMMISPSFLGMIFELREVVPCLQQSRCRGVDTRRAFSPRPVSSFRHTTTKPALSHHHWLGEGETFRCSTRRLSAWNLSCCPTRRCHVSLHRCPLVSHNSQLTIWVISFHPKTERNTITSSWKCPIIPMISIPGAISGKGDSSFTWIEDDCNVRVSAIFTSKKSCSGIALERNSSHFSIIIVYPFDRVCEYV